MWTPFPTPPLSDTENDLYFDDCLDLLYDRDFMPEERLPLEIHELHSSLNKPASPVKKTPPAPVPMSSTAHMSSSDAAVMSLLQQALHNPPQSFTPPPVANSPAPYSPAEFDQYMQGYSELKNERSTRKERRTAPRQVEQKGRELARPVTPPPAVREELDYDGPEWNIIEDQALLTAVRNEEIMCHNFERTKTSLRYNWEYVSGFVNRVTRFYR
ncbi:unnamed protein product [Cylicostephanus goldi]|uniref:Myb-like domain-containing protein n=1 Tax=Cylicostephanus goldi TaxID=71465 RepID=A0A3P6R814_CYLGO|nr:unnamed protein product [Cylicostephanus goldi]